MSAVNVSVEKRILQLWEDDPQADVLDYGQMVAKTGLDLEVVVVTCRRLESEGRLAYVKDFTSKVRRTYAGRPVTTGERPPHGHYQDTEPEYVSLCAGQELDILVSRAYRPAIVLATRGPEALLEYRLPGSKKSALRIVPKSQVREWDQELGRYQDRGQPYKNMSYRAIPKHWLLAIVRNGLPWVACPQQGKPLGKSPRELFLAKWPDEEWRLYTP